ncbi:tRNA:m(4)X modification enzyme TRM13 homolog [Branchiostoma lanceolatum]|uniref:tRNA:m(4)X modification enzyme TRM13 homolog n=1 Tax=Branchiostoma lanceolatum TaxID=7740 RepID=UPI003455D790
MADQEQKERCAFFLKRKQRFCKLVPGPGKKFCGEHANFAPEDETGGGRKRVNCPLDPNHTCYEDQLKKHLKKCNSRQGPSPLYLQKGVNSGLTCGQNKEEDVKISHHSMSTEELMSFVERVHKAYKASVSNIPEAVLSHQGMKAMLEDPDNGASALKHLKQQASLIGHLDHLDLLKSDVCFIEFGAGRGRLSHYVQMCLPEQATSHFILIDRANTKHKFDKNIRRGEKGPDFERLKVDIEDLNLGLVPSMAEQKGPVAAISKHLCGAATDLTLRCLIETLHCKSPRSSPKEVSPSSSVKKTASRELQVSDSTSQDSSAKEGQLVDSTTSSIVTGIQEQREDLEDVLSTSRTDDNSSPPAKRLKDEDAKNTSHVEGILIALCCHHRCTWTSYVGKGFFSNIGFTEGDFHILRSMSSWATCGFARGQTKNEGGNEEEEKENSEEEGEEEKYEQSKAAAIWTVEEREEIGRQCKRLLDQGRLWYLQQRDFHSQLVHYVESDVSLENIAIVATRRKPANTT